MYAIRSYYAYTSTGEAGDEAIRAAYPQSVSALSYLNQALLKLAPVRIENVETDPDVDARLREFALRRGWRSAVTVPLGREGVSLGTLSVSRRQAGAFGDHEMKLLESYNFV